MSYRLSQDAERDIVEIYVYSFQQFGEAQAEHYHQTLADAFGVLASNPGMGRDFSFVKAHTRRANCASHAIYYQISESDVLVLRVLHQSRDPAQHL